jgi:DNA polymerase-3 subunit alpha
VTRGIAEGTARKVFEQMAYFAGYGFNKSHSAAYALLSYQTAYLKSHHPAEFMAATLGCEMDSTDRVMVLVEECRRMGIPVLPPDVNTSRAQFSVTDAGIRFGMAAVKNVGRAAVDEIVKERERGGPYASVVDLCRRVSHDALNRRVVEGLVAAGAMDTLHPSRRRQFEVVPMALEGGARHQREKAMGQTGLFEDEAALPASDLPPVPEWDRNTRLSREREVLGFYLSAHPLDAYRDEISAVATGDTAALRGASGEVGLLGVVSSIVRKVDKKGRNMGFVTVEDYAGTLECVLFADVFEKAKPFLEADRVVLVRGRLDRREPESDPKILATDVFDFESSRDALEHTLYLKLPLGVLDEKTLYRIGGVLERYPGRGEVVLLLETVSGRRVRMKANRYQVGVHSDLLVELRSLLGQDAVRLGESVNGRNGR